MGNLEVKDLLRMYLIVLISLTCIVHGVRAQNTYYMSDNEQSGAHPDIYTVGNLRIKRDTDPVSTTEPPASVAVNNTTVSTPTSSTEAPKNETASNGTELPAVVTRSPLLGVNGSGIRHDLTNEPRVSDPITPDDNLTAIYAELPDKVKAQHNISDLVFDHHHFYNSTFIGNKTYFEKYWANITAPKANVHPILSNSHRRATTMKLSFEFPFYGHLLNNVSVATGGFIFTGEQIHNWLAATQYIAPLMANFDTTGSNDSVVKLIDDGDKFTALWENVTLQEDTTHNFTFAVTLYRNGDIVFAYKDIPVPIQTINELNHPVKVGISDAYQKDRIIFYVRRKTIYEYHRISFKEYNITNNTILMLIALPTCLSYKSCQACVNHQTGFNCSWCNDIQLCSSGTDRNKQDWTLRHCDLKTITDETWCPAVATNKTSPSGYITDYGNVPYHDAVVKTQTTNVSNPTSTMASVNKSSVPLTAPQTPSPATKSPVAGIATALVLIALVSALAAWLLYAFKNPHTRSGQLLIKYRPTQWSWKRGEARYTAATIHM